MTSSIPIVGSNKINDLRDKISTQAGSGEARGKHAADNTALLRSGTPPAQRLGPLHGRFFLFRKRCTLTTAPQGAGGNPQRAKGDSDSGGSQGPRVPGSTSK